jgi:hypothetical protein
LARCYNVDYINTTRIARIEYMTEVYHTLLKQHNCNLNMCELDMMYLDECDIGSKWSQDDIWYLGMKVGFAK